MTYPAKKKNINEEEPLKRKKKYEKLVFVILHGLIL